LRDPSQRCLLSRAIACWMSSTVRVISGRILLSGGGHIGAEQPFVNPHKKGRLPCTKAALPLVQCFGDFQPAASRPANKHLRFHPSIPGGLAERALLLAFERRLFLSTVRVTRTGSVCSTRHVKFGKSSLAPQVGQERYRRRRRVQGSSSRLICVRILFHSIRCAAVSPKRLGAHARLPAFVR